jgi:predicted glycosyltransferase
LRDILDRPERVKASWAKEGTLELIERWYDRVLIYGHRCLFDTAAAYGLSPRLDDRLVHCGYVAPAGTPRAGAGAAWPAAGRRRLLVTAGGGRDGEAILTTSLRALRLLPDVDRPATVLVAGPLMEAQRRADLERLSHGLPVEILRWTSDGRALAAEADLIVCMAGYNTLTECLSLGKRPIVVPRAGPSQEQRLRTELFAGLGLVRPVYPEELAPARMAEALRAALAEAGAARQGELVPLDGGDRAAMELVRLLGPEPTTEADAPLRRAAMGRR